MILGLWLGGMVLLGGLLMFCLVRTLQNIQPQQWW